MIPGNDDAIKGVQLILDYVRAAVSKGAVAAKPIEKSDEVKVAAKKEK